MAARWSGILGPYVMSSVAATEEFIGRLGVGTVGVVEGSVEMLGVGIWVRVGVIVGGGGGARGAPLVASASKSILAKIPRGGDLFLSILLIGS